MILTSIILGAALIVGTSVVIAFWNDVLSWLKRVTEKVKTVVKGVLQGTCIFLKKMKEAAKEISKNYAKVGTKWQETIVEKTISYNEIPEEYRNRIQVDNLEYDYTKELQLQMQQ